MTEIADYQERIPLTQLVPGDFLDEIEPLAPGRGARGGVRGMIFKSRVKEWNPLTGALRTSSMDAAAHIKFMDHTCIIRRRDDFDRAAAVIANQAAAFEAQYQSSTTGRMLG